MPVTIQQMNAACDTVQIFRKEGVTARKIAKEIALVAFSDMADFVHVDESGSVKPIPFDTIKNGKTRIIKKIREKRRILDGKGKDDVILDDTFEIELIDKMDALRLGAECLGLKKPVQIQGNVNAQLDLDEDLKLFVEMIVGNRKAAEKGKAKGKKK